MMIRPPDDPRLTDVSTRGGLLANGWTDRSIARMLRTGAWARPRRGAYVDGAAWRAADGLGQHEIRARAVLVQAQTDLVLSHLTAASVWDLSFWDLTPDMVDVTRRDARGGRREAGVRQHCGVLREGDVVERHGVPVVRAARLAIELTQVTDLEHAFCFTCELLHRGETTMEELREQQLATVTWPRSLNADLMLRLADRRCESVGERRFLYFCWRHHLPRPVPQYEVRDHDGALVARLDFAWPELGVYAEFDGAIKYSKYLRPGQDVTEAVLSEKRREDLVRELTAMRGMRVVWPDLYRQEQLAARCRRMLTPPTLARSS